MGNDSLLFLVFLSSAIFSCFLFLVSLASRVSGASARIPFFLVLESLRSLLVLRNFGFVLVSASWVFHPLGVARLPVPLWR